MIKEIINAVTIPVMAKARIGHFAEAQILESLGVDMVDESEGNVWYDVYHCLVSYGTQVIDHPLALVFSSSMVYTCVI